MILSSASILPGVRRLAVAALRGPVCFPRPRGPINMHAPRPQIWHERLRRSGYLIGAVLLHLIIFLMVATMDVLVGDCGGVCSFFLLVDKVGAKYDAAPDGTPMLPFFQISTKAPPAFKPGEEHPPYSKVPERWQSADN